MNDLETRPEPMAQPHEIQKPMAALVFIHAAPRTSSTWFWTKFRELPSTVCLYEPFSFTLNWLTQARALRMGRDSWQSNHPPTAPYYQEYVPLLKNEGGVQLFEPAMTMQWFIPQGGLRGALRPSEENYLSLLIRHADQAGKVAVFGDCWSLGRCWSIKKAFGGFHIFQYRNLWRQWLSYLSYKRRGDMTFYVTVMDTLCRDDDAYFSYLIERGLEHAAEPRTDKGEIAKPHLQWNRIYESVPRNEEKVRQLEMMPEHHTFALFMGMHIYLYLHAQLSADLVVDVTRMARDRGYRSAIEQDVRRYTGLAASFSDVSDVERPSGVEIDVAEINWDEIKEYARVAVKMLSGFGDPEQLMANANAFINDTIDELRKCEAQLPVSSVVAPSAVIEARQPKSGQGEAAPTLESDVRIKTIGLCMIVKNETKVIRQCLTSVLPLVDYILVVDTGSEDGTQQMIRDFLGEHQIRGAVIDEPWRDFSYNRSFALARLREIEDIDYALVIDADDLLVLDAGFDPLAFKTRMEHDLYDLKIFHGNIFFFRPQLFRNRLEFSFKGVLHEYLESPRGELSRETASGFRIQTSRGGARSQNPRKYQDDAALLERALATENDPFLISRYTFYLAQSCRDAGDSKKAIEQYLRRAELGFWKEEIYVSLYQAARLQAGAKLPVEEVLATYQRAIDTVPHRAEAIHGASLLCRNAGRYRKGYEIAKRGLGLTAPTGGLFVEPWIYNYGLLDEFAVNAYWAGHYRESLDASIKLMSSPNCPEEQRARFVANAKFALEKLPSAPNLGSLGNESFVSQHALVPPRSLRSHLGEEPRVLIAILAKQKERSLPLYLACIEALDYPKSSIVLYIRTNNNTDGTERILRDWVARVGHLYAHVEFDAEDVATRVEQFGVHEWNAARFRVLGRIRNISLHRALEHACEFYFVSDVDNFIRPCTLRELVALNLPIVAPFLRLISSRGLYSNFHAEIDVNGYRKECDQADWILNRLVRGVVEVPVAHCTYLVRADVLNDVTYEDATDRHEYVVFSDSARKSNVPQYLDNRQVYGYITFDEGDVRHVAGGIEQARTLLDVDLGVACLDHSRSVHKDGNEFTRTRLETIAEIKKTLSLLSPYGIPGFKKTRVGRDGDGGYVMLDDLDHDIVCYSLGIAMEISWDLELANRGALVFQCDDSVDGPPVFHENFHFRRVRIASRDNFDATAVTLDTIVNEGQEWQNKYGVLKMDIEGSEWDVLESTTSEILGKFAQIIVEFHGLTKLVNVERNIFVRRIFQKLCVTHVPIHLHGNNWAPTFKVGEFDCPDVVEVTFVNRGRYSSQKDYTTYPTALDTPNRTGHPDLDLGRFPYWYQDEGLGSRRI